VLNHYQSQSGKKARLHFHLNFSLTVLSLAKIVHWFSSPIEDRRPFTVQDIKPHLSNEHPLDKLFTGLGVCPKIVKNSPNHQKLINYAKTAT
jgi:hypothetical protein